MDTNLSALFKTDEELEKDGLWMRVSETSAFRVRRFSTDNQQIKSSLAKEYKPYSYQIQQGLMDPKKDREIMTKIFVNSCLVDWEGVKDSEGNDIPFSKENAFQVLVKLPELFKALYEYAQDHRNYREEVVKP